MNPRARGGEALCAVSVDLDAVEHYGRIFGLPESVCGPQVIHVALPRFVELFQEIGVPATFFVVGQDLADPRARDAARAAAKAGFELANHTFRHRYDLVRLPLAEQANEVDGCAAALEQVTGRRPVGFRAPGYTLSSDLLRLLHRRGYQYDSSVLPSPPYLATKAAAVAALALRGRPSASILGSWRQAVAPRVPYLPGGDGFRGRRPHEVADMPMELPISVVSPLGLPVIGQTLLLLGQRLPLAGLLLGGLRAGQLLNIELHGVDALGLAEDGLPPQLATQPDLRIPLRTKLATLRALLAALSQRLRFVTLAQAAAAARAVL